MADKRKSVSQVMHELLNYSLFSFVLKSKVWNRLSSPLTSSKKEIKVEPPAAALPPPVVARWRVAGESPAPGGGPQDEREVSFCVCCACERCITFWLSTSRKCFSTCQQGGWDGQKEEFSKGRAGRGSAAGRRAHPRRDHGCPQGCDALQASPVPPDPPAHTHYFAYVTQRASLFAFTVFHLIGRGDNDFFHHNYVLLLPFTVLNAAGKGKRVSEDNCPGLWAALRHSPAPLKATTQPQHGPTTHLRPTSR